MNVLTRLALAIIAGGAIFAVAQAANSVLVRRGSSRVALAEAIIEEQARLARRMTPAARIRWRLAEAGYSGTAGVLAITGGLLFSLTATAARLIGLDGILGLIVSIGGSAAVLWVVAARHATRRKRNFDLQLLNALKLMAGQLETGSGIQRAIDLAAANADEPLASKLQAAVDAAAATQDLLGSLRGLRDRYPSRAFDLLLAALEINDDLGGRIEPSLRRASEMMHREFDLVAEARAEVAQARYEFYAVIALMAIVVLILLKSTSGMEGGVWTSAFGIAGLTLGGGNFALGVLRGQRLLNKIENGTKAPMPKKQMAKAKR